MKLKRLFFLAGAALLAAASFTGMSRAEEPLVFKIADFEILSGGFSVLGESNWGSIRAAVEEWNNRPGQTVKFEVTPFDVKASPQEAQTLLNQIIEEGYRYVTGAGTSAIASVMQDSLSRFNERNPGEEIVLLHHQALDPAFTNDRCNYWVFRFDPHVYQRMAALTSFLARDENVKKVFLINQDFNFGHQVQTSAREQLAEKRPDIEIVGEELHPIGRVHDFTPYISKIQSSGADTVITGNFGPDLALLVRAANDIGLDAQIYTYYANLAGMPTAIGESGAGRVRLVAGLDINNLNPRMETVRDIFKAANPNLEIFHGAYFDMIEMLGEAAKIAGSTEPAAIAAALEDLTIEGIHGPVTMRGEDHQISSPLFVATFDKVDGEGIKFGLEGLNLGFRVNQFFSAEEVMMPHTCAMTRPQ